MDTITISKHIIFLSGVFGCLLVICNMNIKKTFRDYGPLAFSHEEVQSLSDIPIVCNMIGLLTITATAIAIFGIFYKSCRIIFANSIFLMMILYLGLLVAYLPLQTRDKIWEIVDDNFQNSFENYMQSSPQGERATEFWDRMQQKLQCCGSTGYVDWQQVLQIKPPFSCCIDMHEKCINGISARFAQINVAAAIYTTGCLDKLVDTIFQKFILLQWIFSLYQIVLSFAIVSSLWIARVFKIKH